MSQGSPVDAFDDEVQALKEVGKRHEEKYGNAKVCLREAKALQELADQVAKGSVDQEKYQAFVRRALPLMVFSDDDRRFLRSIRFGHMNAADVGRIRGLVSSIVAMGRQQLADIPKPASDSNFGFTFDLTSAADMFSKGGASAAVQRDDDDEIKEVEEVEEVEDETMRTTTLKRLHSTILDSDDDGGPTIQQAKRPRTSNDDDDEEDEEDETITVHLMSRKSEPVVFPIFQDDPDAPEQWSWGVMTTGDDHTVYDNNGQVYDSREDAQEAARKFLSMVYAADRGKMRAELIKRLAEAWTEQNKYRACEEVTGVENLEVCIPAAAAEEEEGGQDVCENYAVVFKTWGSVQLGEPGDLQPDYAQYLTDNGDLADTLDSRRAYAHSSMPAMEAEWTRLAKETTRKLTQNSVAAENQTICVKRGISYCPDEDNQTFAGLVFAIVRIPDEVDADQWGERFFSTI